MVEEYLSGYKKRAITVESNSPKLFITILIFTNKQKLKNPSVYFYLKSA
jgi:hypothetical protein